MGQILHGGAKTKRAVRALIQRSKALNAPLMRREAEQRRSEGDQFGRLHWRYCAAGLASKFFLPFRKRFGIRSQQTETGARTVNKQYLKRVMKLVAELAAVAIAVVLLQLFIGWAGFAAAWPILLGVLVILVIIIAAMRK